MITLRLTGRLGKEFGREFQLEVSTTAEAVRALCYQLPGFEESLKKGTYRVKRVSAVATYSLGVDELHAGIGRAREIVLTPVVHGGKKQGLGKIILGVVLIGAAFFTGGMTLAGLSSTTPIFSGIAGLTPGYLSSMGALMLLNGVSAMLTPNQTAVEEKRESFSIEATGNRIEQGSPVPLIYGEAYTGSVVVSVGITVDEIPLDDDEEEEADSLADQAPPSHRPADFDPT